MRLGRFPRAATGLVGLMALAAAAGCRQQTEVPDAPLTRVRGLTVQLADYSPRVSLTGEVRARDQSDVSFRVSGRITERNVDVGDHVIAEQVLAKIDPAEQEANVSAARSVGPCRRSAASPDQGHLRPTGVAARSRLHHPGRLRGGPGRLAQRPELARGGERRSGRGARAACGHRAHLPGQRRCHRPQRRGWPGGASGRAGLHHRPGRAARRGVRRAGGRSVRDPGEPEG